jgi:hypothetical protein
MRKQRLIRKHSYTGRVLRSLTTRGWRNGAIGGSGIWRTIGVAAFVVRVGRVFLSGRGEEVLWRTTLRAGDALQISATEPPRKRRRRRGGG